MKIWCDVTTGKHMRYAVAIAERLRSKGHECWITTRQHPDTIAIARHFREKVEVRGVYYRGKDKLHKLIESSRRIIDLILAVVEMGPDIAISHGSVEQCRVAFGLGIPIICTWDSPHAKAVESLTLPLAEYIVSSTCLSSYLSSRFSTKKLRFFDGVDEVAWLCQRKSMNGPTAGKKARSIVYRQLETSASYVEKKIDEERIIKGLRQLGNVLVLEREPIMFIDALSLVNYADLVVGYGGTLSREAALQGTPSIVIDVGLIHNIVNVFLMDKGFPIQFYMYEKGLEDLKKMVEQIPLRKNREAEVAETQSKLLKLENPIDVLEKIMEVI